MAHPSFGSGSELCIARGKSAIRDRLVLANGLQLPFQSSAFHFVLSSFALNHIMDLQALARELARTTKLEGRLLISEMHPEAYARGWRPGFRDIRGAGQIITANHSTERIRHDLFFAEPERPIFLSAGRGDMFESACHVPAIQVYEFMKVESETRS
jgi:ubiquinone/menaquinone biosynthesis C-methylase UbiE